MNSYTQADPAPLLLFYIMKVFKNADSARIPIEIIIPATRKKEYLPGVDTVFLSFFDRAKIMIKTRHDKSNTSPAEDKKNQAIKTFSHVK